MIFYWLAFILSSAISLTYMIIYRKRFNTCFMIVQIIAPIVNLGLLIRAATSDITVASVGNCLIYLNGSFALPLLFFGTCDLCDVKIGRKIITPIIVIQAIIFLSLITTKYTGFFYKSVTLEKAGEISILVKEYGFMHTVAYVVWALIGIAETGVLVYGIKHSRKSIVKDSVLMAVLLVVSLIFFFVARILSTYVCTDMLTYSLVQLGLIYIDYHSSYYYLDTYNLENMNQEHRQGYILFDEKMNLLVCTKQAEQWFPELSSLHISLPINNDEGINAQLPQWRIKCDENKGNYITNIKRENLSLKIEASLNRIDRKKCYCFAIEDDTAQQALMAVLENRAEDIKRLAGKYIDPAALHRILKDEQQEYENQEQTVAVMFADLRNFTSLMETLQPKKMLTILNKYLSIAEKAIHRNGGTVDKYMGDAVMAFWVDEQNDGTAALNAANTALEIKKAMIDLADVVFKEVDREIFYGIGLNYGKAVVGSIGSDTLKNYTVIGDTVNIAAKLEEFAPQNTIYISEVFKDVMGKNAGVRAVEENFRIKGKASSLHVYELLDCNNRFEYGLNITQESKELIQGTRPIFNICGCRGSYPVSGIRFSKFGGETSCYIIKMGKHAIVIDCGSGFLNAKTLLEDCDKVDVLLTHMHYDHCMGLLNWGVFPKGVIPTFYGNFDAWNGDKSISDLFRFPFWPIDLSNGKMISVPHDNSPITLSDDVQARFYDAPHPDAAKLIMISIAGKRLCIMFDSETMDGIPLEEVQGVDYLFYDGSFDDSQKEIRKGWGHSTWQDGVRLAKKANVGHLIITHHEATSTDATLLMREEIARAEFGATVFARVGDRFAI